MIFFFSFSHCVYKLIKTVLLFRDLVNSQIKLLYGGGRGGYFTGIFLLIFRISLNDEKLDRNSAALTFQRDFTSVSFYYPYQRQRAIRIIYRIPVANRARFDALAPPPPREI